MSPRQIVERRFAGLGEVGVGRLSTARLWRAQKAAGREGARGVTMVDLL